MGKLSPGVTPRRWIPEGGEQKHREKIHKESKFADDYKKLPFSFSKPSKPKRKQLLKCKNCGHVFCGNIDTVGVICVECKQFSSVVVYEEE